MTDASLGEVGGYQLLQKLGEGSFGTVYRARSRNGQPVALKVAKALKRRQMGRLLVSQENEIEALLRLKHPNVVGVSAYGHDEESGLWVAMEYVEGQSLRKLCVERRQMDAFEAIPIMQKIVDAVVHCHALDILHLDLKPENIIIVDPVVPRLKVLDFGLAHLTRAWKAKVGTVSGTPAYMPPEALTGLMPNSKHDLYAIGTIFYQLLAGKLPFESSNVQQAIHAKMMLQPLPLLEVAPMVPPPVASFVERMIAPKADARPATASDVRDELRQLYFDTLHDASGKGPAVEHGRAAKLLVGMDETKLVGREDELAKLWSGFAAAEAGESAAILVQGETGLGKSRLAGELLARLEDASSCVVAYGRCRELGQLVPYSMVREGLGELVRVVLALRGRRGDAVRRSIVEAIGEQSAMVCGLIPELVKLYETPPDEDASLLPLMRVEHLGAALRQLVAVVAAAVPVVLVFEDLHWCDDATTTLVRLLVTPAPPRGSFVLLTARDGWQPPEGVSLLPLEPLTEELTDRQISSLLGGIEPAAVAELKALAPLLTAGNPLYNVQVLRNLVLEGLVSKKADGALHLAPELARGTYRAPDSVANVLGRTIDRLEPSAQRILGTAALMGRQFSIGALKALELASATEVDHALVSARALHLCHISGDDCLIVHDSVVEQLSRVVPLSDHADIHRRIAENLKDQLHGQPGTLAHHLEKAGQTLDAARVYIEAGEHAGQLHDPAGAVRLLRQAITLLVGLPADETRNSLLVDAAHRISRIGSMIGANDEVLTALEAANQACGETSDERRAILDAAFARALYSRGQFLPAVERSRQALGLIGKNPALSGHACVPSNILGRVLVASGKFGMASEMLTRGCKMAEELGEYQEVSHSEGVLSVALGYLGKWQEAKLRARSCAALAERLGDPVRKAGALFYFQVLGESSFDTELGVESTYDLLCFIEQEQIGGLYLQTGTVFGGRHQFHLGRLDRAQVMLRNGIRLSEIAKIGMAVGWAHAFLGDVYLVMGDYARAKETYDKAVELGNQRSDEYAAPPALIGLSHLTALTGGSAGDVVRYGEEGLDRFEKAHNRTATVYALQRYGEALNTVRDPRSAEVFGRREALIQELGVEPQRCDWWPSPPVGLASALGVDTEDGAPPSQAAPVSQRYHMWKALGDHRRSKSYASELAESHVSSKDATSQDAEVALQSTLVAGLSSEDGFVPKFALPK